jgi:tellurite resistance protein
MFLNVLEQQEQHAFLQLAHQVAYADGYINEMEAQLMMMYKHEIGLSEDTVFSEISLQELIAQFKSEASKNAAFIEILGLILTDGEYNDEERMIVSKIKEGFGFSLEKYEMCKAWVHKVTDTYKEGLSIIHG